MNEGKMIIFSDRDLNQLATVFSILWNIAGLTDRPEHREAMEWVDEFQQRMRRGITIRLPEGPK